jgi:uncharacterized membrane protein
MAEEHSGNEAISLTKSRLEGLSDGIFAFAMTLLVIGLSVPDQANLVQSNEYVIQTLFTLHYAFLHYVLAFLVLGAFWLGHHAQLHPVKYIDRTFVWINLITLLFVALLPFTTSFSGDFSDVAIGSIVFQLNLFAVGIGMYCQWKYATTGNRLTETAINPGHIRRVSIHTLVVPVVSVICILAALAGSLWSSALYMAIPFVDYALERIFS